LWVIGLSCNFANGVAAGKIPVSRADFLAHKGESFTVFEKAVRGKAWSKSVALKLVEVSELRSKGGMMQFSVRFQGPADATLEKSVYTFEQVPSERFSLFLEPAGNDAEGRYYQAIFNSLK
jgi:hypothetical protein